MGQALTEPPGLPPATEEQVRSHALPLTHLAVEHGITELAFASPGRLRGHLSERAAPFASFDFQLAASELLGAEVVLFADGALRNKHVSPDLLSASPL